MKDAKGLKQREKENLEWKENLFFLCAKYRNTPPGFYSEEEKEKAYKELEKAKKEFEARSVFCINGGYHATAAQFAGRKRYLAEIEQNFSVKKSPVVLYGIGGIGKSALAREYVRKHQKDYDTVLFLSYNKGFLDLICDDNQLPVTNLRFTPDKYGTKNRYFKEKIKIITEIAKEYRILIIIDDCNTQGDTKMERVFALPCDILVTSRMTPAMWGNYKGIPVKELETEEEWRELIRIYQRHELSEKEQKSIQDYGSQVNGHTLLMIMKIRGADMEGSAPKDFAEDIFSRFSLKKDEKQVLRELSIMPVAGISADFYHKISKTSEKSVERLVDYLLIRREITVEGMEILSLHPLIAESARRMFKLTMSNCYTLIQGLSRQLWNAWNRTYQQNQRLEPYVFAVLSVFPKPEAWLARQMQEFVTVVWIQGYFKEAEIYCRSILESVKSYYGEIHQMTAEMCLSLAAVYYNSMNFEKANVWYWKGFEIINACSCFDVRYYFVRLAGLCKGCQSLSL